MRLTELNSHGFRCLEACTFHPEPGINVLRGSNAQGKTTVLEAILFAATSKSHRTNNESELPRHGEDSFSLRVCAEREGREILIEAHWWRGVKRYKINGVSQTRVSDILGRLNTVFFSPEDVGLVKEGAGRRRHFLDMELSQIQPRYLAALQQYRLVLRQRNELLRQDGPDPGLIDVWDPQLAAHGAVLIREREAFLTQLSGLAEAAYAKIAAPGEADGETMTLCYRPDVKDADALAGVLAEGRKNDIRRRLTQRGPHRDDIDILIAGRPARVYGSQGQQKTAALALKLAETGLVQQRTGEYPVLMLDEVLAELDARRARHLFEAVPPEVQLLVTTTNTATAIETAGRPRATFSIQQGRLEKEA